LDVVAGVLLLAVTIAGTAALHLANEQRRTAVLLNALHDQERLVYRLAGLAQRALTEQLEAQASSPERASDFQAGLAALDANLRALQVGGSVRLIDGESLRVPPARDVLVHQHLTAARRWLAPHVSANGSWPALLGAQRALLQQGEELQTYLRGLVAAAEHVAFGDVFSASRGLLLLMVGSLGLFVFGILLLRRLVTTPLHRMADMIEAMLQGGRLVKLPVGAHNELGIVSEGFNRLTMQAEEQKRRLREHIVDLQRANAELDQLAHVKDDFLMTINHQLRTPLTSVVQGIELLRDGATGEVPSSQRDLLSAMEENAQRLTNLIDEVLDLTMLRSGRRPLDRVPAALGPVLRRAQLTWQPVAEQRTIRLAVPDLPNVHMDAGAVGEVLDHLLRNALRHAPAGSDILVEARAADGQVEVAVRDHGRGMSRQQLEQLFQPFVHVHTPDAPGAQGSGLGLAFCRQVIERHRGTIRADAQEGQGMTVTFTLPVASPTFLLEEACHVAEEAREGELGEFGLLVAVCPPDALARAEQVLRGNTHRGDAFVPVDAQTLAVVAVTDRAGFGAMVNRLRGIIREVQLPVQFGTAVYPLDGTTPAELLAAARANVRGQAEAPRATMPGKRQAAAADRQERRHG
jgi:signal transduction histidine kinase